ncbi:hypothetical protein Poli38472_008171 [Pythium oligandrum]|uniref:WW domain-containing protein n=1 Tax=Pythium oligandrum TaxID=41045 RepID=A0A8K1CL51_PYTOL|nr:hypothetical protein Poli38472_008171 [Pythium oligandrum]|eukprot:TMW65529.1 hypothetical protein Poli38472_008171 [Pythium oligandrum]
MARQDRKMLRLHFEMAANCIQRTFRRNCERRIHRDVMQKSSRPMYLRAKQQSVSFRERYYLPIVRSAASVIQSTWRKYLRRKRRKQQRGDAARILCEWTRRCIRLSRWKHAASHLAQQANEMRRDQAAGKISRWMAQQLDRHHCQNAQVAASMAQQLAEMLRAAMVIQRCHRRRHGQWRGVINSVMTEMLPRSRLATHCIQRAWRCYCLKQADRKALATVVQLQEQRRVQEELHQQHSQAASRIQRAYRRLVDRRNGKLLLKRYKIFYQRELLRKQQRQVIHRYLDEQQTKRRSQHDKSAQSTNPLQPMTPLPFFLPAAVASSSSAHPSGADPIETESGSTASDDTDVVKCWSDEYQRFYLYNARTGESTWTDDATE